MEYKELLAENKRLQMLNIKLAEEIEHLRKKLEKIASIVQNE